MSRRSERENDAASPAASAIAVHCAVLLRGGLHPHAVIAQLARELPCVETRVMAEALEQGASVAGAFAAVDGPEWRVFAAAWRLAEESGAPLADALQRIGDGVRSVEETGRRREVLLATPRMTVKLVNVLPLAALGVGVLLGFNPLPVLITPFGMLLVCAGLVLQLCGAAWARRLVRRALSSDRVAGLECELAGIALAGGASPERSLVAVADAVADAAAEWVPFDGLRRGTSLTRALSTAAEAGVPPGPLLRDAGLEARAQVRAELEVDAERLGVRILLPLTLCVLPAFVALGVVPVVVRLFGDVFVVGTG